MPSVKCSYIGMECVLQANAPSREELLMKIGMRAHEAHQMKSVPSDVLQKIQNSIKYWANAGFSPGPTVKPLNSGLF